MLLNLGVKPHKPYILRFLDYLFSSFISIAVFFTFLAFWDFASFFVGDFILHNPKDVIKQAYEMVLNFQDFDIHISLKRAFIGTFFGVSLGIILGISSYFYKSFLLFTKPLISISLSIAPIAWVVLALFWFGFGDFSIIFVVLVCTFSFTFGASLNGLMQIPQNLKDMCFVFEFGYFKTLRYIYIPFCLFHLLPATLIAVSNAIKLTIMCELLGAVDGVGAKLGDARAFLENDVVLAYILLCIIFLALFEFLIIKNLELLITAWRQNYEL